VTTPSETVGGIAAKRTEFILTVLRMELDAWCGSVRVCEELMQVCEGNKLWLIEDCEEGGSM